MKQYRQVINILLAVAILGFVAWYISTNWADFSNLRLVHPIALTAAALLVLSSLYSAGMVNELTMEPHGIKPGKKEVFYLASITRFLNQIAPNYAGASVRAVYFKKHYGVSYAKFSSSFVVANILQLVISCFIALVAYTIFRGHITDDLSDMSFVFVAVVVLALLLLAPTRPFTKLFKRLYTRYPHKVLERLSVLPEEFAKVRSHPGLFGRMVVWMTCLIAIQGILIYALYYLLGVDVHASATIFIAAMVNLSLLLSITPAGLGIQEGILVFGATLVGLPVHVSLAVSLLLRVITIIVAGLMSLLFVKKLF